MPPPPPQQRRAGGDQDCGASAWPWSLVAPPWSPGSGVPPRRLCPFFENAPKAAKTGGARGSAPLRVRSPSEVPTHREAGHGPAPRARAARPAPRPRLRTPGRRARPAGPPRSPKGHAAPRPPPPVSAVALLLLCGPARSHESTQLLFPGRGAGVTQTSVRPMLRVLTLTGSASCQPATVKATAGAAGQGQPEPCSKWQTLVFLLLTPRCLLLKPPDSEIERSVWRAVASAEHVTGPCH